MSRLYANLGNLAPSWRLVVFAAVSLVVWLAGAQNEVWAGCADYVKVANPQLGMVSHETDTLLGLDMRFGSPNSSVPTLPCRGPHCGRGAPITPLSPSPVVVQTLAEQFAVLALSTNPLALENGLPLMDCQVHPLAGYSSPLKRPPRA